jgi:hypothetical protein
MPQCVNCNTGTASEQPAMGCFTDIGSDKCYTWRITQGESSILPLCFMSDTANVRCYSKAGGVTLTRDIGLVPNMGVKLSCAPTGYEKANGFYLVDTVTANGTVITFKAGVGYDGPALPILADICFDSVSSGGAVIGCAAGTASSVTQPIAIAHTSPKNWLMEGAIYRKVPTADSRQDFGVNAAGSSFYHVFDEMSIQPGDSVTIPGAGITSSTLVERVWSQLNANYNSALAASYTNAKVHWYFSLAGGVSATATGCFAASVEVGAIRLQFFLNNKDCWEVRMEDCQSSKLTFNESQLVPDGCDMVANYGKFDIFANVPVLEAGKLKMVRKFALGGNVHVVPSASGLFGNA